MKFSEKWLREWVNPSVSTQELAEQLTMAGLEVAAITPVAGSFSNVLVGKVLQVETHPNAERLHICQIQISQEQPALTIICGAKNVRPDLKVAVAIIGSVLPNNFKIKKAKLRGVESYGMICSSSELGLSNESAGIMELPNNAPIGIELSEYLELDDNIITIELTPNRSDCLSINGLARELATINKCKLKSPKFSSITSGCKDTFPISISAKSGCPRYVGRVIRDVNQSAQTPLWITEKLRRSDIKTISAIVDITNYVMLELGQPLHAFDLAKLDTKINVRYAGTKEKLTLLDGQELQLTQQTLVIADQSKALAMAGVMGGEHSMVTDATSDIFLESAFFSPIEVANAARSYGLHTESSHRFERGVDFELQAKAIERATELILQIAGGTAGPTQEVTNKQYLPTIKPITLRKKRITHILGITIAADLITNILQNLQMQVEENQEGWEVRAPTHRFDITSEIDLIEEIARIYGYNNIPNRKPNSKLEIRPTSEKLLSERRIASLLLDKGYHEAITYSFVSLKLQELLQPEAKPLALQNPISQDMAVMRTSLWPGLIQAVLYNLNRQQSRIRLFETGLCFNKSQDELKQQPFLAGVITGNIYPQQWGVSTRTVDFFDLKGDIESLFSLTGMLPKIRFVKESHPALHPGKSTKIYHNNNVIGALGELHPGIKQKLDINTSIYLFELDFNYIRQGLLPQFNAVSKYPIMRRDIAIIVDEQIPSEQLIEEITSISNELLQDVQLFDIYQGEGVEKNKKSVALNLIFQHNSRTLIDTEIDDCVAEIVKQLQQQFNIVLRG